MGVFIHFAKPIESGWGGNFLEPFAKTIAFCNKTRVEVAAKGELRYHPNRGKGLN
jgi:hypothetical protein